MGLEHLKLLSDRDLHDRHCRELNLDLRFFARRPERHYRLRRAFPAEVERWRRSLRYEIPPDKRLYVAIGHRNPRAEVRVYIVAPPGVETDLPEVEARTVFEMANHGPLEFEGFG